MAVIAYTKSTPPEGYDEGLHQTYLEKLKDIEEVVIPKFVVGKEHHMAGRKINLGIISDGQFVPKTRNTPFIPGTGHTFIWGLIGAAKTLMALVLFGAYSIPFRRIQFTADLMPADIIGYRYLDEEKKKFDIAEGPLITGRGVLLDELPRATPKTLSAGLEKMESWQVTIWDKTFRVLPESQIFFAIGTGNPIESEGVFELPDALVDRFAQFLDFSYLFNQEEMKELLTLPERLNQPGYEVKPVMTEQDLVNLRAFRRNFVRFSDAAQDYITRLTLGIRSTYMLETKKPKAEERRAAAEEHYLGDLPKYSPKDYGQIISIGPSDRAMAAFLGNFAKAHAFRRGSYIAEPSDAREVAEDTLSHRIRLTRGGVGWMKDAFPNIMKHQFQRTLCKAFLEKEPILLSIK